MWGGSGCSLIDYEVGLPALLPHSASKENSHRHMGSVHKEWTNQDRQGFTSDLLLLRQSRLADQCSSREATRPMFLVRHQKKLPPWCFCNLRYVTLSSATTPVCIDSYLAFASRILLAKYLSGYFRSLLGLDKLAYLQSNQFCLKKPFWTWMNHIIRSNWL